MSEWQWVSVIANLITLLSILSLFRRIREQLELIEYLSNSLSQLRSQEFDDWKMMMSRTRELSSRVSVIGG